MNTKDLHSIWNAPDNSRLTSKQYTVRLPIRVAAQLAALSEMYPKKTMTDLIGDLLTSALDELAENLPTTKVGDQPFSHDENGEAIWEARGPGITFGILSRKYLEKFEAEELAPAEGEPHGKRQKSQPKQQPTRKPKR